MTREEFRQFTRDRIVYLDGATGSNLIKAGMPSGVCPEQWILEHREVMLELQKAYVEAGTDILYTPTFSANRVKLKEYGLEESLEELTVQLTAISKEASGGRALTAGDLTMTGEQLVPVGKMELEELIDIYRQQILSLVHAGADLLVVETMMSLQETRAALIAAREVCSLPVMATVTFEAGGRTLYGTDPVTAAVVLESLGADAVGANCSTGPARMTEVIRSMAEAVGIPIIAKPNAGLPAMDENGNTVYDMDADTFANEMRLLAEAGASVLGGCCGTTPEYIRLLRRRLGRKLPTEVGRRREGVRYLCSERMSLSFSTEESFIIVGERINPTGKKKLQQQLREGSFDMVRQFAREQEECGAKILDINMGMSGIDEKEMMLAAIQEAGGVTNLPLSLDSSHISVLEAALRHYPGRALVNSISLEKEKFERLLPLAARYGAMFILLPLSDKGLPENQEEKKQIIHTILDRALELGMRREDIVVDGLVTTVGANKRAAVETLETIAYCRELGLATVCGLSNISFGMPERGFVNAAFLTMAIRAGLTMAIANPSQELIMGCALASDLLLGREESALRYIEYADKVKVNRERREAEALRGSAGRPKLSEAGDKGGENHVSHRAEECRPQEGSAVGVRVELENAVLKGNRRGIEDITRRALEEGETPSGLLNEVLLPAINLVGEYFDKGKYFLPQLIASAEAMKLAIGILEPLLLRETSADEMPVVVIATVEGDIHDIGKNLVALMLKNYGFRVIDLGKDVPKEEIIAAAKENKAQIIALSALMTTTMQRMKEVIESARTQGVTAKIMIGGAVVTPEYAEEISADGYSADAAGAVRLAKRLTAESQD